VGANSDQLDLIPGKNLARLLRIEPEPSAPKTMDISKSADEKFRCVSSVVAKKMDPLIGHS
jgi:hypothetical protein